MDSFGNETFLGTPPPSPGASDNVTVCSNPGLPVAASTVARARPGCGTRISDVQASYLEEGRLSLPSKTPPSSQSDSEPVGKLALNLQDDLESTVQIKEAYPIYDNLEESSLIQRGINQNDAAQCSSRSQDSLFEILPLELLEDLSIGICSLPQTNREIKVKKSEPGGKLDGEILSEQCSTSHLSFLENEKLLNLASFDEYSTDDDIDDGEFYDDRLEAYFEQLVPPEMLRGDTEIQELSECCTVLELLENGLNQVPTIHGAVPRVDATTASNKEAHELGDAGHHEQTGQFLLPKTVGESNRATFRPGLEGISEEPSFGTVANSETEYSHSAENQVISVPITANSCSIKESGNEDGVTWVPPFLPKVEITGVKNELAQAPFTCVIPVYAEDSMNCGGMPESINIAEVKISSLHLQNMDSNKNNLSEALLKQGTQSSMCQASSSDEEVLRLTKGIFVDDTTPKVPVSENTSVMDTNLTNEYELGLADTYLSPTADSRESEYQGDQPHNVVYQNEEGKWVTDLAYYTSFDKEQDINLSEDNNICEDFITGSEAVAMIAQDEQEFERERRFLQVGKIDALNTTGLADISWKSANSYNLLRASQTFDPNKDASYLCLSLGEFFSQRSEALGRLGGGSDVKRPSFGYQITSPEKKQPVALLRESDAWRGNLHEEERSQLSDAFPEDGDRHVKEYTNSVSTTFTIGDMEAVPRINESINMHTVTESKAEELLDRSKLEYKLPDFTDSVLSISTIASAIANASISADPSQLAAMIMALSNKNLKKSFHPEADKDTNLSTHQLLSSNVENSAFDMEKYLKKTEEPEHGSEPDNFAKYEAFIQDHDSLLPDKHKHQDTLAMDLLKMHNKNRRREKQLLDCKEMTREGNSTQDFSCASNFPLDVKKTIIGAKCSEASDYISEYPQPKRTSLTSDVLDTGNISNEKEAQMLLSDSATKKEVAHRVKSVSVKQSSKQTSHVAGCSYTGVTDKAMNLTVPVPSESVDRTAIRSTVSISNLKPVQESSIHYPTRAKSTQQLTKDERQGGKIQKRIMEASTACNSDKKYLTSGKLSEMSQKSVEQKSTAPECDLQSSEDEQYSFRPSTSPLIHSSPSEASGTSVSGSEIDSSDTAPCFQKASYKGSVLLQSICSSPNISQLTYISSTDSALKNSAIVSSVERRWSEDAIELSTTIVRASPTPLSEEPAEKLHDLSWQRNRKVTSDNILNTNSYTGQPPGTFGVEHWESLSSSGFGHVRVPEELKFPNVCCVGIASQTILSIFNPTERWLQVSIGILSVSVNGEKIDPMKYPCLVFKNKTIVGPHSTEELKILFLPCYPGVFQCVFSVSSWPVSADAETIVQAEALASRVVLTAVAENPNLEVETGKTDGLDFGDLTCDSWKSLPLKLINKTQASVPIRLIINANAVAWRCFTFSKEPVNGCSFQTGAFFPVAAPSVVNHVMHANCNGQDPETLVVWVLFHAPKKHISCSDSLGPADEFVARVDVEVDSLGPTNVIKSIPLRARAGTARIHAPQDLQTICLSASVGSSAKQQLPLKNAGNIEVYLKIKTSNQDNCFCVQPEDLFLKPGEEQEIVVTFSPTSLKGNGESILEILVLPSGPQYEVVVKGEVEIMRNKTLATAPSCSDIPPILSNKQFVAWGGVALGRADLQKLTLRNNSPSTSQHLRLLISGQDQDCFQLQSTFGTEERLTSTRELKIRPKEDANIYLMFAPSRVTYMLAKLEIKQLGIQSQPGFKFSIPLCGYGGTSNVILEDVRKVSDCYVIKLNGLLPGKLKKVSFRVRNTGSRAAYVRTLCFSDLKTRALMDLKTISVFPEKFVLKEKTQEVVTITWNPVEWEEIFNKTGTSLLATICLFCGDEVSRQQYHRAILCKPEAAKQILPEHSVLRNVKFDEEFRGEQLVAEAYDLHPRTNYINLFYGNMRKVTLSVVGDSTFNRNCLQQSPGHRPENSEGHINTTLDVLPVKGPQGPSLSLNTDEPLQSRLASQHVWAIQPEHLILTSPSLCGTAETGHLKIMNKSSRMLKFEMSWPAHCLTVTPQHGIIEPESCIVVLVSPNPSLATKLSEFPWSGIIYVHCDNGHKFVKVLIREEIVQDASAGLASKTSTPPSRSPRIHMAKPLPKPPSTKVQIKNRTIVFPETGTGESSENYLEIENNGDEDVKWCLSSFAPPYVKGVDKSEDVYRATYSAFRCSRVFGTIEGHGKEKVIIIFLPRDKGNYTQFWDLECHPLTESHVKHKQKFQLSGVGTKTENKALNAKISTDTLIKTEISVSSRRRAVSEASAFKTGRQNEVIRGVYAPEDVYTFLPTRVGESSALKVNLRNNSFITHMLKFESPREPFYIKHSKYSLRSLHYINLPVQFKPKSAGRFEALLVVHTDKCSILGIRLCGEALERAGE
ncbi:centrosomal protein of [Alligator mississippiensis]|uniref:Centrosomal protein of n=1 Tax=Alligator mississippiensis TaxID=8496 RepID=A0A151NEX9_ALLMI|nr:centrosomal protein of [Alligator mississippiensis]